MRFPRTDFQSPPCTSSTLQSQQPVTATSSTTRDKKKQSIALCPPKAQLLTYNANFPMPSLLQGNLKKESEMQRRSKSTRAVHPPRTWLKSSRPPSHPPKTSKSKRVLLLKRSRRSEPLANQNQAAFSDPLPRTLDGADIQRSKRLEGGRAQVQVVLAAHGAAVDDGHLDAPLGVRGPQPAAAERVVVGVAVRCLRVEEGRCVVTKRRRYKSG